jgi:UDP-glucose 4-epimerase
MTPADYREFYRGRRVMITGGLGFIGSNLAHALVALGADVLLVDSLIPDYGGHLFNIAGIEDRVRVNVADVRQQSTMDYLVRDREVIFNLAGQVSHIDSMRDPFTDLEINCRSQLTILEACRRNNPGVKVVYAGTRQVYGKPDYLPVDEKHLVRPTDVNGINKVAGEYYHLVYNNVFGVRGCSLRLTNVFGPRQDPSSPYSGVISLFISALMEGRQPTIYGDGGQTRDFTYVANVVDGVLRACHAPDASGRVINVATAGRVSLNELFSTLCRITRVSVQPRYDEPRTGDVRDSQADLSLARTLLGYEPLVSFEEGLRRTVEWYRATHQPVA